MQLASERGSRPEWDSNQQELRATLGPESESHTMWISDANSLRQRVQLARRYRLQGFSAWRLGQEDPAIWRVLAGDDKAVMQKAPTIPAVSRLLPKFIVIASRHQSIEY